jgi:hypothetical protein
MTVDKSLEYRGDLATTPLAEILFTVFRYAVPGVLEVAQAAVIKRLYVRAGSLALATSSDRNDSLGVFLRRSGRLNVEQFADTMRERSESDRRYGALLVERGLLSPAEVCAAVEEQMRGIVWSLFGWEMGQATFRIAPPEALGASEVTGLHLPLRRAILEGVVRGGNAKALLQRMGRKESLYEACFHTEDLIELRLDAEQHRLATLINGQRTLYELCTGGTLPPADAAKLLYALHALQLIRRAGEPKGAIKIKLRTEGGAFAD